MRKCAVLSWESFLLENSQLVHFCLYSCIYQKHKLVSKLHFFFLFPSTNKIQQNYWDTALFKQPCLINTTHIWYVGEPSLVLHSTLFFFCKLKSFLLSPAKILLMSNKCTKYVYIVLLCLEWPRRVPAVCINTIYILGVLCLCPQLISAVSFSISTSCPLTDLFSEWHCISYSTNNDIWLLMSQ